MLTDKRRSLILASALLVALLAPTVESANPPTFDASKWLNGPDGLVKGVTAAETEGKILVVYFYTDWCGYCRQFEKAILGTPTFNSFLDEAVAVRINPEKGAGERSLAGHYGVRGFPSFFVYGSSSKQLIATERYDLVDGRPQLLTPEKFIARIRSTSER